MENHKNSLGSQPTLLAVFDEYLQRFECRVGKDRAATTLRSMQQTRRYLSLYMSEQLNLSDIPLSELLPSFISDFSVWLSAVRALRGGTVWLASQHLKGVVTRSHQQGIISWNPFAGFHIAKNIRPREYLTEEELSRLMTHTFNRPELEFTRDIFLFSAFTGMAFIDIKGLCREQIVDINGAKWIVALRHKTHVCYQVKLLDIPLIILRKYGRQDTFPFAKMEYRTMAKRIHRVMAEVGIHKRITLHCARHSFAVMALNNGMPIESLSRMLGHTNITTTQIYAKITLLKLDNDMTQLAERLSF